MDGDHLLPVLQVNRRRSYPSCQKYPFKASPSVFADCGAPAEVLACYKLAGLGFGGAVEEEALAQVECAVEKRGVPVQAEIASLVDPASCVVLARR